MIFSLTQWIRLLVLLNILKIFFLYLMTAALRSDLSFYTNLSAIELCGLLFPFLLSVFIEIQSFKKKNPNYDTQIKKWILGYAKSFFLIFIPCLLIGIFYDATKITTLYPLFETFFTTVLISMLSQTLFTAFVLLPLLLMQKKER